MTSLAACNLLSRSVSSGLLVHLSWEQGDGAGDPGEGTGAGRLGKDLGRVILGTEWEAEQGG
jgi:hypothetical protein